MDASKYEDDLDLWLGNNEEPTEYDLEFLAPEDDTEDDESSSSSEDGPDDETDLKPTSGDEDDNPMECDVASESDTLNEADNSSSGTESEEPTSNTARHFRNPSVPRTPRKKGRASTRRNREDSAYVSSLSTFGGFVIDSFC